MHTTIEKRVYTQPEIACIELDNQISLALESAPPAGPDEVLNTVPTILGNDPYKTLIS